MNLLVVPIYRSSTLRFTFNDLQRYSAVVRSFAMRHENCRRPRHSCPQHVVQKTINIRNAWDVRASHADRGVEKLQREILYVCSGTCGSVYYGICVQCVCFAL